MGSWQSYPSIYNLGHRAIKDLLLVPHYVEEKVDGSQFSFGLVETASGAMHSEETGVVPFRDYELMVRSKGAIMIVDAPMKMFTEAVNTAKFLEHKLHKGWTYRCEYLMKPKHNTLSYDRIPEKHLILFDVSTGDGEFLSAAEKKAEADRIGLECVPVLHEGPVTLDILRGIIDNQVSVLGGQKIEGVVIKQKGPDYLYGTDKKILIGKFVSERFKEAHKLSWGESNPTSGDILTKLGAAYGTPGRWLKAIQHLRDAGALEDSPRDIGKLLIEIQKDTGIECKEEIQKALWKWAWPHVSRLIIKGFPEYYKQQLMQLQFERGEHVDPEDIVLPCVREGCEKPRLAGSQACEDHVPGSFFN